MAASLIPRRCASGGMNPVLSQQMRKTVLRCSIRELLTSQGSSKPGIAAATDAIRIKSYEEIPGPKALPLIGNGWRFLPVIGEFGGLDMDDWTKIMYDKYGPIVRLSGVPGRKDMLFVYTPEDVETTFRNEGPWPQREGGQSMEYYRNFVRKEFFKDAGNILSNHGPTWFETRSKMNQPMMQPKITRRYVPAISGVAEELVNKMRTLKDEKDELPENFINELFKWSLESIACVALDARLGCLEPNLSEGSEPQRLIDAAHIVTDKMYTLELGLPLWKVFPTPTWKEYVRCLDIILDVTVKYVKEAMQRIERQKAEGVVDGGRSVLEQLLETSDPKMASIMAQDMLFGGIDTTSYSSAVALYMLSKNPDKQELLFEETKRFLPNKDSPLTEEALEEMKFLKACFKECSRMRPVVSGTARTTVKETVLSNYRVPTGVCVVMPNVAYRYNEEIYPSSKRFIPERWLKLRPTETTTGSVEDFDAVSEAKKHPFALLPFGFGPRSCVGRRFAEMEMETLVARVIRNFKLEYNYGEMRYETKILTILKDPLRFKLTERSE